MHVIWFASVLIYQDQTLFTEKRFKDFAATQGPFTLWQAHMSSINMPPEKIWEIHSFQLIWNLPGNSWSFPAKLI